MKTTAELEMTPANYQPARWRCRILEGSSVDEVQRKIDGVLEGLSEVATDLRVDVTRPGGSSGFWVATVSYHLPVIYYN